jgi:hypothetical protein
MKKKAVSKSSKTKFKKPTKTAVKSAVKAKKKPVVTPLKAERADQALLNLANKPYAKLLKQIKKGKALLKEERRLAVDMGLRILTKAKAVRDSLMQRSRSPRG